MLLYEMFLLYMKKPYAVSTPCAPRSTPTRLLMLRRRPENPFRILADLQVKCLIRNYPSSSFKVDWRNDKGLSFLPSSP